MMSGSLSRRGVLGQAAKLADSYLQARKEDLANMELNRKEGDKSRRCCLHCGKPGHLARKCRVQVVEQSQKRDKVLDCSTSSRNDRPRRDLKEVQYYNCHKKGHYSANCPHNALFSTERRVERGMILEMSILKSVAKPGVMKSGVVEGKLVDNILLDTRCSLTLVHKHLVPEEKLKTGDAVAIRCAYGDTVLHPLADISLEVNGKAITVEAAVCPSKNNLTAKLSLR